MISELMGHPDIPRRKIVDQKPTAKPGPLNTKPPIERMIVRKTTRKNTNRPVTKKEEPAPPTLTSPLPRTISEQPLTEPLPASPPKSPPVIEKHADDHTKVPTLVIEFQPSEPRWTDIPGSFHAEKTNHEPLSPEQERARQIVKKHLTQDFLKRMKAFLIAMTHGKAMHIMDDIVQTSARKAWEHADQFQEGTDFSLWFKTILRNTYISNYRSQKRSAAYIEQAKSDPEWVTHTEQADLGSKEELHAIIRAAQQGGIPKHRIEMFIDAYLHELSYKEIAEKYGITEGTVMSGLYRTRRAIIGALAKYSPETKERLLSLVRNKTLGE